MARKLQPNMSGCKFAAELESLEATRRLNCKQLNT